MSVLTAIPIPKAFVSVKPFHVALDDFKSKNVFDIMEQVGQLFVKHEAYNSFGISLPHKHFELDENEILVETLDKNGNVAVAIPWKVTDDKAYPTDEGDWKVCNLQKYVSPMNWYFDKAGGLIPFEFAAEDIFNKTEPKGEFVSELFNLLKKFGVEKQLGLKRIDYIGNTNAWEDTPQGQRANIYFISEEKPVGLKKNKIEQVVWRFDENGKISNVGMYCEGIECSSSTQD